MFKNEIYKEALKNDPFIATELNTLLGEPRDFKNTDNIKTAYEDVIKRQYKRLYPDANELVAVNKDHIVIPPYLYLSLTDFYTVFSVYNYENAEIKYLMRHLDENYKSGVDDVNLEKGFHIIIKKLGDGKQDFFSRVDVKFVLLEKGAEANVVIDKIFEESTFYGHIPTQTILQDVSIRGGNKTLKNNKRRLKKRRKYTQSNRRK